LELEGAQKAAQDLLLRVPMKKPIFARSQKSPTVQARPLAQLGLYLFMGIIPGRQVWAQTSAQSQSSTAPRKSVICSATIGSDDELLAFKKHLGERDFEFKELTEETAPPSAFDSPKSPRWFNAACASKINCDVLIISAHFAGTFLNVQRQHLSLPLDEINKRSCAATCEGIIKNPKEVYLLGCNTLALKNKSPRPPERYHQDLRSHSQFDSLQANRAVNDRHNLASDSYRSQVLRAFSGVRTVYGFTDRSPLGKEAGPRVASYLRDVGDFKNHLDLQATATGNALRSGPAWHRAFEQQSGPAIVTDVWSNAVLKNNKAFMCGAETKIKDQAARRGIGKLIGARTDTDSTGRGFNSWWKILESIRKDGWTDRIPGLAIALYRATEEIAKHPSEPSLQTMRTHIARILAVVKTDASLKSKIVSMTSHPSLNHRQQTAIIWLSEQVQ
jgi:hypothetical protein